MKELIDLFIDKYPWLSLSFVWLIWFAGALWEYRTHRNKQVTSGGLFFLLCCLLFAIAQTSINWYLKLVIGGGITTIVWLVVKFLPKKIEPMDKFNKP